MDKQFFINILYPLFKIIKDEGYNIILLLTKALEKAHFCKEIKVISDLTIFILWLFLVSSLIWMIYEIFKNIYQYFKLTSYRYFKDGNPTFADSPSFKQLENMFYFNDFFSIDFIFITFVITAIFVVVKLYIFKKLLNNNDDLHFKYIICFVIFQLD